MSGLIDVYLTDLIDIVSYSINEWGVSTNSTQENVRARVENNNMMVFNAEGKEIQANSKILLDSNIVIKLTDRIKLKKINGVEIEQTDTLYQVRKIDKAHGFTSSHIEVFI